MPGPENRGGEPQDRIQSGAAAGPSGQGGGRRYRHRGARRAVGGTAISQGEPAGWPESEDGAEAARSVPDEARGRWLLEQRPPHWG